MFYRPAWHSQFAERLLVGESTRHGGISSAPYQSLNLGRYTADDPEHVLENRRRFCEHLGIQPDQLVGAHQIHGSECRRIHRPGEWDGCDAFITNKANIFLTITVADCTPILLYDPAQGAVGAAHAGWRGTVAGIAAKTLRAMRDAYGTVPADCWAFIGTCIGADDFQVDADVANHFPDHLKRWAKEEEKFYVNLKASNREQLEQLGVPLAQIEQSPFSTVTNLENYFSYRAEGGVTGRMLGLIGIFSK